MSQQYYEQQYYEYDNRLSVFSKTAWTKWELVPYYCVSTKSPLMELLIQLVLSQTQYLL